MRRYIDTPTEPTLTFVEDAHDGGCMVECPYCGEIFNEQGRSTCPCCHKDLVYPSWTEW